MICAVCAPVGSTQDTSSLVSTDLCRDGRASSFNKRAAASNYLSSYRPELKGLCSSDWSQWRQHKAWQPRSPYTCRRSALPMTGQRRVMVPLRNAHQFQEAGRPQVAAPNARGPAERQIAAAACPGRTRSIQLCHLLPPPAPADLPEESTA